MSSLSLATEIFAFYASCTTINSIAHPRSNLTVRFSYKHVCVNAMLNTKQTKSKADYAFFFRKLATHFLSKTNHAFFFQLWTSKVSADVWASIRRSGTDVTQTVTQTRTCVWRYIRYIVLMSRRLSRVL